MSRHPPPDSYSRHICGEHTQTQPMNSGMFSGADNVLITGGTFVNNVINQHKNTDDDKWMERLLSETAAGAFHNSDDRRDLPKCHPHTRTAVLKEIMDWVTDSNRKEQFLWIYGPAGTGKSSIAQTIAELCEEQGRLASDFFFSRTATGRNSYGRLIPTLAYQLTLSIPDIRDPIAEAIRSDGLIFSRSLATQLNSLILQPLAHLASFNPANPQSCTKSYPNLVILDGLDECDTPESQRYILSSLSSALRKVAGVSLIIFIASRPEHAIRVAFNGDLHERTLRLVLDDKYQPDEDIKLYLKSKFEEIRRHHPLASSIPYWPSVSDVEAIVHHASGQFIYASTVVKFVQSHRDRPTKRLDIIFKMRPPGNHTPFSDLDALYRHILLSVDESMTIFAFLFTTVNMDLNNFTGRLQEPEFIEAFLGYEPGEVLLALADLHSLVDVPELKSPYGRTEIWGIPSKTKPAGSLRLFHASLGDFLQDKARSGSLHIDIGSYCANFSIRCIEHLNPCLSKGNNDIDLLGSSDLIRFAHRALLQFLTAADSDTENLLLVLSRFSGQTFMASTFDENCTAFAYYPAMFDWLRNKDVDLYNMCTGYYANQIKHRLALVSDIPGWQYILTSFTILVNNKYYTVNNAPSRQLFSAHLNNLVSIFDRRKESIRRQSLKLLMIQPAPHGSAQQRLA